MEKGMTEITDIVFSKENEESIVAKQIDSGEEEKNSGGILNDFISNLVSPSSPKVRDAEDSTSLEAHNERERGGDGDGDGGLIENLVSHLPSPLADDAAPATEEASILIHSIVHD